MQHCLSVCVRARCSVPATTKNWTKWEFRQQNCPRWMREKKQRQHQRPQHNAEHIEHHIKLAGFRKRPYDERLSTFWHTHRASLRSSIGVAPKRIRHKRERERDSGPEHEREIRTRFYEFSMISRCTSISPHTSRPIKMNCASASPCIRAYARWTRCSSHTNTHVRIAKLDFRFFGGTAAKAVRINRVFPWLFPMALCVEALSLIRPL